MIGSSVPELADEDEAAVRAFYETARDLQMQFCSMLDGDFNTVVASVRQAFATLHHIDFMVTEINAARPADLEPIPLVGEDRLTSMFRGAGLTLGFMPPSDGSHH